MLAISKIAEACAKAMRNPRTTERLRGDTALRAGDMPAQYGHLHCERLGALEAAGGTREDQAGLSGGTHFFGRFNQTTLFSSK